MLNKCQIIGHLGSDPEMRNSENGSLIATFKLSNDLRNNLKSPVYLEGNHELPYGEEK